MFEMNSMKPYRKLSDYESALISRLLSEPFVGRDEIRAQISECLVMPYPDGTGFIFLVPSHPMVPTKERIPVEGEGMDIDGQRIHYCLHVVDGKVDELEIVKESNSPVFRPPDPREIQVTAI